MNRDIMNRDGYRIPFELAAPGIATALMATAFGGRAEIDLAPSKANRAEVLEGGGFGTMDLTYAHHNPLVVPLIAMIGSAYKIEYQGAEPLKTELDAYDDWRALSNSLPENDWDFDPDASPFYFERARWVLSPYVTGFVKAVDSAYRLATRNRTGSLSYGDLGLIVARHWLFSHVLFEVNSEGYISRMTAQIDEAKAIMAELEPTLASMENQNN